MATAPDTPQASSEDPPRDERPELLVKLQERKKRHAERGLPARIAVVVLGVVLVLAGILLSGPGIPGPGFLVILIGLSFLALEFDRAERLLERAIVWADRAKVRAESASPRQKALTAALTVLAIAAFVVAAILWDIPLLPV
ncbi:MAG: PGPGW domain-containing protein [Actinomycetota bacterium]|nr:PGPGW domain-containing protein [Actinomycetota bacterium]